MAAPVDDRLVTEQAARLGAGGLRFTPRQLYYAVCAQLERGDGSLAGLQIALGAGIAVVGLVLTVVLAIGVIFLSLFGLAVAAFGAQDRRQRRRLPRTRPLALSYAEFLDAVVEPRRRRAAPALEGLIETAELEQPAPVPPAEGDDVCALVVCDRRETAALLRGNEGVAGLGLRVADAGSIGELREPVVFALHDADPAGCRLPVALRAAGAPQVIDIGLRPAQVLQRHVQVIQGAPAFVPPEVGGLLTTEEIVWLADGHRVELAIAGPGEILGALRRATGDQAVPVGSDDMPEGISVSAESPIGMPPRRGEPAAPPG